MPDTPELSFGFYVERESDSDDRWSVSLPHQCERWDITGDEDLWYESVPHAEAVKRLEAFIDEARLALHALRGRQTFGEWSP